MISRPEREATGEDRLPFAAVAGWSGCKWRAGCPDIFVETDPPQSTLYYDGSCPLCRAEIEVYRRSDCSEALAFVDVSEAGASIPSGLSQRRALERFHVRAHNGELLSGAAAFVEVWARLPRWRWAARAAALPGAMAVLEFAYCRFLPVRPAISRLFGKMQKRFPRGGRAGGR